MIMPVRQTCPKCGKPFMGSDAVGDNCLSCKVEVGMAIEKLREDLERQNVSELLILAGNYVEWYNGDEPYNQVVSEMQKIRAAQVAGDMTNPAKIIKEGCEKIIDIICDCDPIYSSGGTLDWAIEANRAGLFK